MACLVTVGCCQSLATVGYASANEFNAIILSCVDPTATGQSWTMDTYILAPTYLEVHGPVCTP